MTHELEQILEAALIAQRAKNKCVLVSLVHLNGSSYRKPGVRMLIKSNGKMIGAVSGGCVEKEILRQAQFVFDNDRPKMMIYDGRFRLGCEGQLYLLLEPFNLNKKEIEALRQSIKNRERLLVRSYYHLDIENSHGIGSYFIFENKNKTLVGKKIKIDGSNLVFSETLLSKNRLLIAGSEHDAIQLSQLALFLGWDVEVLTKLNNQKTKANFPAAVNFIESEPENYFLSDLDNETAIVLMTHNFAKDLKYLFNLRNKSPKYIGVLGPVARLDNLLNELMELAPDIEPDFLENIHGPAGLDIGSISPQEIALSIMSQILSIFRNREQTMAKLVSAAKC